MQTRITLSFVAGMTSLAFAGQFELVPTADAEVRESNAMERRGDPSQGTWHTELSVRSNENKFCYMDFNLVPLAGKTIRSADFRLTVRHKGVWPANGGGIRVYAFKTAPTWNEETIYYRNLALHDNAEPKRTLSDPDNAPGLSADYQKNWSPPPTFLPINTPDTFDVKLDGVVFLGYMNYDKPTAERPALTGGDVLTFTGSDQETGKQENDKNREALVALLNGMIKNNRGRVTFLITSKYEGDPGEVSRSNMILASREFDPDGAGPLPIGSWAPKLILETED